MALSKRLQTVVSLVTPGKTFADIGTDHAFVPIELVKSGRCPKGLACDVRPGPLSGAEEHIRQSGLSDRIGTRLGDGLQALLPGEADSLIITGMGGRLILGILAGDWPVVLAAKELIIGAQSDLPAVRKALRLAGFRTEDERMLTEDGKTYVLMKCLPEDVTEIPPFTADIEGPYSHGDVYGPVLLARRDPELFRYLSAREKVLDGILSALPEGGASMRRAEVEAEKRVIRQLLEEDEP